jgi:HAD superfamily hydrolase (TIGR01509 family)
LILFDLGGVLVDIGDDPLPPEWLSGDGRFTLAEWFSSPIALAFEKGEIFAHQFAIALKDALHLRESVNEIIDHFTRWPRGVFPKAETLLSNLQLSQRLGVLTNSNELHWPRVLHEFNLPRFFSFLYSSHLIDLAKPDPAVFRYVLNDLHLLPNKVLFFDDNPENVYSAEGIGIVGVQVDGPDALELYLAEEKLIDR